MEDFFRSVAIGLGVMLGTLNPGIEPQLQVSLVRGEGQVAIEAVLVQSSPKMEQALNEGVAMTLKLKVAAGGQGTTLVRTLSQLPLTREWEVRSPEGVRSFAKQDEAMTAWGQWPTVRLMVPPSSPFVIDVQADVSFPGHEDWKSDLVWKVPNVVWRKSFARLSEIPF